MQQKLINNVAISSRILILFFIICTLLVAKSLFLIMFITVLTVIVLIIIDKNVKLYVEALKNSVFWLLFLAIIYIMIFRDVFGVMIFIYKMILIVVLLNGFVLSINFGSFVDGIYTIMIPFRKIIHNLDKKVYDIAKCIYFYIFLICASGKVKRSQQIKNRKQLSAKYYLLPKLFFAVNKISELENGLRLSFYKIKNEKINFKSRFLVICFFTLFVTAVFKEVIL